MLIFASVTGLVFIIYQFIFLPIDQWQTGTNARYQNAKTGYEQVILAARLYGEKTNTNDQNQPGPNDDDTTPIDTQTPLKNALSASAATLRLVVTSTEGDGERVQISLAPTEAERIYNWMTTVKARYGAVIIEANFNRSRNNDRLISANRLVFTRNTKTPSKNLRAQ